MDYLCPSCKRDVPEKNTDRAMGEDGSVHLNCPDCGTELEEA